MALRASVEKLTWGNYAAAHDNLFKRHYDRKFQKSEVDLQGFAQAARSVTPFDFFQQVHAADLVESKAAVVPFCMLFE